MSSWFRRYRQRQADLAQGADADLVRENSLRRRRAIFAIALGGLLSIACDYTHLSLAVQRVLVALGIVLLIYGVFLLHWAGQEDAFLHRPDPVKPPSLFKQDWIHGLSLRGLTVVARLPFSVAAAAAFLHHYGNDNTDQKSSDMRPPRHAAGVRRTKLANPG